MKVALLGATKGMGRALARILVERGHSVFLLGHEPEDLQRSVADLQARAGAGVTVGHAACNLEQPTTFAPALDAADRGLGGLEAVVVTAALFATQDRLEEDRAFALRLLNADFSNTVIFCEEARVRLLARGGGALVVFSSVAGDRGRKPVIIYGAAKAGLSAYLEALDHKFHATGLRVLTVKPGFVKTGMTAGLRPPPFAGEPEGVAKQVANALERGNKAVIYAPPMWKLIMLVIRLLPRFVMRKIGF